MVTIIDPNGSPSPVYTKTGTTIETLAASGTTEPSATQIVAHSGWTVVIVATTSDNRAVRLPADANIGDVVEVYATGLPNITAAVFPASGDDILGVGSIPVVPNEKGALVRKTAANEWRIMSS